MTSAKQDTIVCKVIVVGDVATGKTSFIQRYCRNTYSTVYQTTIGVDFALKTLKVEDLYESPSAVVGAGTAPRLLKMQIWDTAGQERFSGVARIYYKDAVAAFVVYDIADRMSFANVRKWKEDIDSKVFLPTGEPIPVFLIGSKCDKNDQRAVRRAEGLNLQQVLNFQGFFETSAKENINVTDACEELARHILTNHEKVQAHMAATGRPGNEPVRVGHSSQHGGGQSSEKADNSSCC